MIRIGYGKAHFPLLIKDKAHYVDRTDYIERLEESGEAFVFFLRPRRFGKSLWVSILNHYYAVQHADKFDTLFGKYYIGQNPTVYANQYLVLNFDFSGVDSENKSTVYQDFFNKTHESVSEFLVDYAVYFTEEEAKKVLSKKSPHTLMSTLFSLVKQKKTEKQMVK